MPAEYANEDRLITARVGEEFVIALAADATTGYTWHADFNPSFLAPADDQLSPAGPGFGSAGMQRVRFRALAPGNGCLRLSKRRSSDPSPVEKVEFRVQVSAYRDRRLGRLVYPSAMPP